ncbi:hypothetical protein OBP_051 [Pseudomonas phage OBP]|uniref:hypothetical protein n=1 Tax=Pseudomonas phage OBP TaxID=1124849 RepID=UPI000240D630|nr:hypothetical protein OBP_051 [Pseudomonas phage OBP]AEV89488.1 hypothetical protein OBP_051 [Pseudomonas phage OBP]
MRKPELYSFNIFPLLRIIDRYKLDSTLFFKIILNFLSHRREEILNVELSKWFSPHDVRIKLEMKPILYQLMHELNHSDNVEDYFVLNKRFYIKDHPYDPTDEFDEYT